MILLRVQWLTGSVRSFSLSGHAGYARAGTDIVCAAVSALVYNAINSCEQFVGVALPVVDEETLTCDIPSQLQDEEALRVQLLIQSMIFGIREIQVQYGAHVTVLDDALPDQTVPLK